MVVSDGFRPITDLTVCQYTHSLSLSLLVRSFDLLNLNIPWVRTENTVKALGKHLCKINRYNLHTDITHMKSWSKKLRNSVRTEKRQVKIKIRTGRFKAKQENEHGAES